MLSGLLHPILGSPLPTISWWATLGLTVVSDKDAVQALELLLERAKVLTEPAASCTLAAAIQMKEHFRPEHHIVLVLCGGNLGVDDLCEYHARFLKS
jgi:threonine dehydratase